MIAVFPNGVKNGNGKRGWEGAPYAARGVSDKLFTSDLLDYMRENYCIDDSHIYATGKSNGGGFVDLLACSPEHGGDFAAFAMNSAALYNEDDGSECLPARTPMPIMEFHGTNDHTIPYAGNTTRGLPDIDIWLSTWAVRNGCSNPPTASKKDENNDRVHYTEYNCGGVDGIVQGYRVDGQGHWWISTVPNDDNSYKSGVAHTAPVDASIIMMKFFSASAKL